MATTSARYGTELNRLADYVANEEISETDQERITELCRAYDETELNTSKPNGESYREPRTLTAWMERLITIAQALDGDLTSATVEEVNSLMQSFHEHDGKAKSTVRSLQFAARRFYRYHDDLGVDPDEISTYRQEGKGFDPDDILTKSELDELAQACSTPRDSVIFNVLRYTGLRVTALTTLRVKDVKPDEGNTGRYRLNPNATGLKGAGDGGEWRPLLGAAGVIRDWLVQYHPDPKPNNYLITQEPKWPRVDPTEPVDRELPRRTMIRLKEETGIEKPMHPHMMRHNAVTVWHRDYDMDPETIKWLLHHAPDSRVWETTYSHLSDEDWIERAEVAAGAKEPDETKDRMTPKYCQACKSSLEPDAKACRHCGAVLSVDAWDSKREINQGMDAQETEIDDMDMFKEFLQFRRMKEKYPEMYAQVLEEV